MTSDAPAVRRGTAPVARVAPVTAVLVMLSWLALLWALELVDALLPGLGLDLWGVNPRQVGELPQMFTAPFIHFGFDHLVANSIPFFILGLVILLGGVRPFLVATFASVLGSGLAIWFFAPVGSLTAGASGLIFGWLTFILARGIFSRSWIHLLIGIAAFALYGGVLWGVLPTASDVSWQGHLGGAIGGLVAARWISRTQRTGS